MKRLLLSACVVFTLFFVYTDAAIDSMQCYVCNSYFQPDCADKFDNSTQNLVTCPAGYKMCRKIVQEAYYDDKWDVRYIRQCARLGEVGADDGRRCKDRTGTNKVKVRYCHCDNQLGCNGATGTQFSFFMLLVPVFGVLGLNLKKFL